MTLEPKTLTQLNADSIRYLAENTDITHLGEGSIARALVEASNQEISNLQNYVRSTYSNVFLDTATGFSLDLIGKSFGLTRGGGTSATASAEDYNVKFFVNSGRLGEKFPSPTNLSLGLIPAGIKIMTLDGDIIFMVPRDIVFPFDAVEAYVPVVAEETGYEHNVGRGKLVSHSGPQGAYVINTKAISNGSFVETDQQYRARIGNFIVGRPTSNALAIRTVATGSPDISNVVMKEFARGAGTYDAMLVPVGNTVSLRSKELVKRALAKVTAFGISYRVKEPEYVRFRVSVQLISEENKALGSLDAARLNTKNAILDYIEGIPLGGELIINRLEANILSYIGSSIKDVKILDICLNGRAHVIRNIKLQPDQLFTPDLSATGGAIQVI